MTIVSSPELHRRSKYLVKTVSSETQEETETECSPYFVDLSTLPQSQIEHLRETGLLHNDSVYVCLLADKHIEYLKQTWDTEQKLRPSFVSLDASRPWMLYWTLHPCDLLGYAPSDDDCLLILNTLKVCWTNVVVTTTATAAGGFGGGPSQMPHAATTYAAILTLCILASQQSSDGTTTTNNNKPFAQQALQYLQDIREPLFHWMMSLREKDDVTGGVAVRMQHDGEMDVRATYCVVAVAKLLGILRPELTEGMAQHLASCQTYEGGFGGEPWSEAHGGYTFCATAALYILGYWNHDSAIGTPTTNSSPKLNNNQRIDFEALTLWLAARQMGFEGGFSGRSNKLVDGCYSFWQGGAVAIVSAMHQARSQQRRKERQHQQRNVTTSDNNRDADPWLAGNFDQSKLLLLDEGMLERYILLCAQDVTGGLRDKPSKRRDFYHSCYNISGLSVVQHCGQVSFGHPTQSRVAQTHPCYNIRIDRVRFMLARFADETKEGFFSTS
ncbi:hypothetical protein ACA910_012593 [Epithemia clementina (nom. ined.)]